MLFKRPYLWTMSILLMLTVVAGGCSAAPPPPVASLAPVPPLPQPAPLPVSPNISVTAEQLANADPCDLINQKALSMLGTAELALHFEVRSCEAEFTGPGIGLLGVSVEFSSELGSSKTRQYQGVTIHGDRPEDNGSCERWVVASTDAVLTIASDYTANEKWSACRIADRAIEAAVSRLIRGDLRPADYPVGSLARQDACRLIAQEEANRIPGINRSLHDSGYRGRYCQWGEGPVDKPGLYLAFQLSGPLGAVRGWRPITVAERPAFIQSFTTNQNQLASCEIQLINGPAYRPSFLGDHEAINILVHADQSADANCSLVTDLATKALTRMAQPR